ncbi:hypothetical protein SH611_17005 [Geminicoccaceae bacterium 1502E]|nr:hypothetical protein [Geminicoccaceae bacterium 1502E]
MVDHERLEAVLIQAARERRPVTYGQLLGYFGRKVTPITVGALCRDLGRVCSSVEARGGPDLAVLVVRKSDGLPGEGYFTALRAEGLYDGPSAGAAAEALVRRRQEEVFAFYEADEEGVSGDGSDRWQGRGAGRRGRRA